MYSNLYFIKWLLEHAWNSVRGKCHQFLYRFLWKSVYYCTDWSFSPQLIVHSWNILGQEITGPRVKIYPIWFCISTSSNARWQGVAVFIEVEKIQMSHARGWKARQQQGRDAHQRGPPPLPQANARPPPPMMSGVSGNGRPRNRDKNRRQQRLQAVRDLGKRKKKKRRN